MLKAEDAKVQMEKDLADAAREEEKNLGATDKKKEVQPQGEQSTTPDRERTQSQGSRVITVLKKKGIDLSRSTLKMKT